MIGRELRRLVTPRAVIVVRMGSHVVPEAAIQSVLSMVCLAMTVNFFASLLLAACGLDVLSSIAAVAACMFNVGPGLGAVGPAEHYGNLPLLAKWVLIFCMFAGRLEFYTALVLFIPGYWRK